MSSQEFLRESLPGSVTVGRSTVPRDGLFGNDDGNISRDLNRHVHIGHRPEDGHVDTDASNNDLDDVDIVGEDYGTAIPIIMLRRLLRLLGGLSSCCR